MTLSVGTGISGQMAANGDHPVSDETTWLSNADGTVVQTAYGTKGRYFAANGSGQWEAWGPEPVPLAPQ